MYDLKLENDDAAVIPIVFSINDAYVLYGYTAIYSLIKHINEGFKYRIYILFTKLNKGNRRLVESLSNVNVKVACVDISETIKRVRLEESLHLSIETYYRLFIPLILPEYDRVLYLDSDMVILNDVSYLYSADLNGKPIGVVADVPCGILKEHSENIGIPDYKKAFNAGVLLMDVRCFEEERVREKCLELLEEDYKREERKLIFADQDALNLVLYDNVTIMDPRWNCQYQYAWRPNEVDGDYVEEYLACLDKAWILHYAGTMKPWDYPCLPKSDLFWNVVKETSIFCDLIDLSLRKAEKNRDAKSAVRSMFRFPYEQIPYGSRIIIYGAGRVGKDFIWQMKLSRYAEVMLWVDRNAEELSEDYGIKNVDSLKSVDFDFIVISIKSKSAYESAKEDLIRQGIDENKIFWTQYRKVTVHIS